MPSKVTIRLLLFAIISNALVVNSQGGGGGGGGSGGGGGGSRIPNGGSGVGGCLTSHCKYDTLVISLIFGGIIGLGVLFCVIRYCIHHLKGKPLRTNKYFVEGTAYNNSTEKRSLNMFVSGIWTSRYHQYGKCHGPHTLSLNFDSIQMTVTGHGYDNVGSYDIIGVYSTATERLGLTKRYKPGTGNSAENLGHHVTIQLYWNSDNKQFEGRWYVQTCKYHGDGKFELKLTKPALVPNSLKV